jgi:hypothetical protein
VSIVFDDANVYALAHDPNSMSYTA